MKKLKSLLPVLGAAVVLFSGCDLIEVLSEEEINKRQSDFDKTLTIDIPDEYDGKECFLIYTNTGESDSYIGRNASLRSASSNQRMTIYKGVTNMGGGYYRDEVVFNENYVDNTARSAGDSGTTFKTYRDLDDKSFFAFINTAKNYIKKDFIMKYNGSHCRIWFWNNTPFVIDDTYLSTEEFAKLGKLFDSFYSKETDIFGSNVYQGNGDISADENTKIDILIYDLFGDAKENQKQGTFGLFYSHDLSNKLNSNKCQAIHIDSFFLMKDIEGEYGEQTHRIASTIVHEFQHLLNYCNKDGKGLKSEKWYNEMLSLCAEDIFQNIISTTNEDSPKSRLYENFNSPYQGFVYWPESEEDLNVLNSYGNAYAYGAYLMRNYGGINLIHEIATNNSANEDSISDALKALGRNEDFISTVKNFGYVYILNENNNISLNKNMKQIFKNITYELTPIDLSEYCYYRYDTLEDIQKDKKNVYRNKEPDIYRDSDFKYVILGPRIYQTSYQLIQPIRKYGFAVYYLGKVNSDQTYEIPNPGNNIEYEIVSFD